MISASSQTQMLTGWMEALSDLTRLRLLHLLERRELGVAELCDILQMPQSTVSRHLKLLAEGGWLHSHRNGTANLYRMTLEELAMPARRLWTLSRDQVSNTPIFKQDELRLARRLEQRQSSTAAFFAGTAGRWDKLRLELYGQSFQDQAMMALLSPDWTVVDLGCGTGQMTAGLADHVARVIGVDQSEAMLRAARKRIGRRENVEIRRGDLDALPLESSGCDAALLVLVLTYVDDVPIVLKEAVRVLRGGGRLVVVDVMEHGRDDFRRQMGQACRGFRLEDLSSMLTTAGIRDVSVRPLTPESNVKGPVLLLAAGRKPGDGNGAKSMDD